MTTETKLPRLGEMTSEQKRIAIAEACGWHCCGPYRIGRSASQRTVFKGIHPQTSMQAELPDYTGSLDAMAEAEKALSDIEPLNKYEAALRRILMRDDKDENWTPQIPATCIWHATAAQRADAFLIAKQLAEKDF